MIITWSPYASHYFNTSAYNIIILYYMAADINILNILFFSLFRVIIYIYYLFLLLSIFLVAQTMNRINKLKTEKKTKYFATTRASTRESMKKNQ